MTSPMQDMPNIKGTGLYRRLFREFIRVYIRKMTLAAVLMIVVAICTAVNALLLQPVIDDIFVRKDMNMLYIIVFILGVVTLVNAAANYGQSYIMRCVGQKIVIDMQTALYKHLLQADLAYFGRDSSGKIISRFTNDIQILRATVSTIVVGSIKEFLSLIFLIGVMFYQSWTLSLIVFIAFPLAIYPMMRLGRRMRKISHGIQEELGEFTTRLDETFKGVRVIKAYQQEQREIGYADQVLVRLYKLYAKAAKVQSLASPIMEALGGVAVAAVIWYGGAQVIAGETTSGKFFSFLAAVLMAYKPLKTLSGMHTLLQEGMASAQRFFTLLDEKPKVVNVPKAQVLHLQQPARLEFQEVDFAYEKGQSALKGLNLVIEKGQTVALVGPSGAGKSTIINLLLRFYDPQAGHITIDGKDIRHVTLESLRKHMAIVSQETFLFDGTVAQNIAYANPNATLAEIKHAAKAAAADEFIDVLPQQYDAYIGEGGAKLSGGQRQRIAIARAILKDAPVLLLDEATSALDSVSEQKIKVALESLRKGRTTIVVAHRLSTVINADKICVLKAGKVVEQGTHQELLEQGGEYVKLYSALELS